MIRRALMALLAGMMLVTTAAATPSLAAEPNDLQPLCKRVGHSCGVVVGPKDGKILGRHYGHNIGSTLDPADVERILQLAQKVRAAEQAKARRASIWDRLAQCEAGGNWASTVGLYEGGLQFHPGTWDAYKYRGYPAAAYQASREQQIAVAERVLDAQGWGAWPACSRKLGLR